MSWWKKLKVNVKKKKVKFFQKKIILKFFKKLRFILRRLKRRILLVEFIGPIRVRKKLLDILKCKKKRKTLTIFFYL